MWKRLQQTLQKIMGVLSENWKVIAAVFATLFAYLFGRKSTKCGSLDSVRQGTNNIINTVEHVESTVESMGETIESTHRGIDDINNRVDNVEEIVTDAVDSNRNLRDTESDVRSTVEDIGDTISRIRAIVDEAIIDDVNS